MEDELSGADTFGRFGDLFPRAAIDLDVAFKGKDNLFGNVHVWGVGRLAALQDGEVRLKRGEDGGVAVHNAVLVEWARAFDGKVQFHFKTLKLGAFRRRRVHGLGLLWGAAGSE